MVARVPGFGTVSTTLRYRFGTCTLTILVEFLFVIFVDKVVLKIMSAGYGAGFGVRKRHFGVGNGAGKNPQLPGNQYPV